MRNFCQSYIFNIIVFLIFFSILVLIKIKHYNYNITSLIGFSDEVNRLNPNYIERNSIIFKNSGYDGQFFYLTSKFLFSSEITELPILDSFKVRFRRIGYPLVTGPILNLIGFQHYTVVSLIILTCLHFYSSYLLKLLCKNNLYLIHFYSPFVIISNLLLLADTILVSLFIITISLSKKIEITRGFKISSIFIITLISICLTKETGIFLLVILFISDKYRTKNFLLYFLPLIIFVMFYLYVGQLNKISISINPLEFTDLIDYPLFGFIKSFSYIDLKNSRDIAKTFGNLILVSLLFSIILQIINNRLDISNRLILSYFIITILLAEVGYWLNYENIARFFTLTTPIVILNKSYSVKYRTFLYFVFILLSLFFVIIKIFWGRGLEFYLSN
ncbi:MAG: hypothetical protein SFU98_21430 [Leptospiraceae bacterium]|nr:hypothetical protein [Leptospiraceae bacterium]